MKSASAKGGLSSSGGLAFLVATLTPDAVRDLSLDQCLEAGTRVFALLKATSISYLGPA